MDDLESALATVEESHEAELAAVEEAHDTLAAVVESHEAELVTLVDLGGFQGLNQKFICYSGLALKSLLSYIAACLSFAQVISR